MPAWDIAFNNEHSMIGWRIEGMTLFTCHTLWKKVKEDEVNSASKATDPGSLLPSTASPIMVANLASNTTHVSNYRIDADNVTA